MNILQVHNYYQIPGGEDTVVENERQMLERHGHRVIQYTRDNKELADAGVFKKLKLYGESFFSFRTYREIRQVIRKERVDLVHVHNTVHLISPSVFYAAMKEGVPVVQTLHNFRIQCPAALFYRDGHICEDCLRKGTGCAIRHKCYRGSRLQTAAVAISEYLQRISGIRGKVHYICLTEFNKEKLLEIDRKGKVIIPPENVSVKPNFVPLTEDESKKKTDNTLPADRRVNNSTEITTEMLLNKDQEYYISIGRLEHIKGTHMIVKAFARLGYPLVIVGQGEQEEKIRSYIKRHGIKNIVLTGQLSHEEAMALLKNAKALVIMPQWYETFGMNVIEAYAQGVPVITNDIGNAAALAENNVTGIKCHNNVRDLEKAIKNFASMDQKTLKENVSRRYRYDYSEEKNYDQLINIYNNVIRQKDIS